MDELDRDLSRMLKNWAAETPVPKDGRRRLLRTASSLQPGPSWWEDILHLMPFLEPPQRSRFVERYALPSEQTVDWYFQFALSSRLSQ